jgi:hypothetical protein
MMIFTTLFIILFIANNDCNLLRKNKSIKNDTIELEDHSTNYNPIYEEDYWWQNYKELIIYFLKSTGIIMCLYFDILYIDYTYLQN